MALALGRHSEAILLRLQVLFALVEDAGGGGRGQAAPRAGRGALAPPPRTLPPRRVELQLWCLSLRHEAYAPGSSHAWRLTLSVHDAEARTAPALPQT